jgi:hypothetical protein
VVAPCSDDEVVLCGSEKLPGQAIHIHNIIGLLAHALRFAEPPRFAKACAGIRADRPLVCAQGTQPLISNRRQWQEDFSLNTCLA